LNVCVCVCRTWKKRTFEMTIFILVQPFFITQEIFNPLVVLVGRNIKKKIIEQKK
jgi:hypothetical protein